MGSLRVLREDKLHCAHVFQVSAYVTFPDIPLAEPRIRWEGIQSSIVRKHGWMHKGGEECMAIFAIYQTIANWDNSSRISSTQWRHASFSLFKNGVNIYEHSHPNKTTNDVALEWRLANSGLWIKSGPLSFIVNKVLLEHCHTHSFSYSIWLLSHYNSRNDGNFIFNFLRNLYTVPTSLVGAAVFESKWQGHWSPCWSRPTLCFVYYSQLSSLPSLTLWPSQRVCEASDLF